MSETNAPGTGAPSSTSSNTGNTSSAAAASSPTFAAIEGTLRSDADARYSRGDHDSEAYSNPPLSEAELADRDTSHSTATPDPDAVKTSADLIKEAADTIDGKTPDADAGTVSPEMRAAFGEGITAEQASAAAKLLPGQYVEKVKQIEQVEALLGGDPDVVLSRLSEASPAFAARMEQIGAYVREREDYIAHLERGRGIAPEQGFQTRQTLKQQAEQIEQLRHAQQVQAVENSARAAVRQQMDAVAAQGFPIGHPGFQREVVAELSRGKNLSLEAACYRVMARHQNAASGVTSVSGSMSGSVSRDRDTPQTSRDIIASIARGLK